MTSQTDYARYIDRSVHMAVDLVNHLTPGMSRGRTLDLPATAAARRSTARRTLDRGWDAAQEPSPADLDRLWQLAAQLRPIFEAATVDDAAPRVADLIQVYRPAPQLHREATGRWCLHFHSSYSGVADARGAGCATALAMLIEAGESGRLGVCQAERCDRVYYDASKNGRRRFCSTACTNRTRTAQFRRAARAREQG